MRMETILKVGDLSLEEFELICSNKTIAVDTETTGLNFIEDKLCTIQINSRNFNTIIRFNSNIEYPNLTKILQNSEIEKIFHNAVFDVSFLMKNLMIENIDNIVCTKISSKIINGIKHNNSLKTLLKEYLDIEISKDLQLSNWEAKKLSNSQLEYAINDVCYLPQLWDELKRQLEKNNLLPMAKKIFDFIPTYVLLKMREIDNIFAY